MINEETENVCQWLLTVQKGREQDSKSSDVSSQNKVLLLHPILIKLLDIMEKTEEHAK